MFKFLAFLHKNLKYFPPCPGCMFNNFFFSKFRDHLSEESQQIFFDFLLQYPKYNDGKCGANFEALRKKIRSEGFGAGKLI